MANPTQNEPNILRRPLFGDPSDFAQSRANFEMIQIDIIGCLNYILPMAVSLQIAAYSYYISHTFIYLALLKHIAFAYPTHSGPSY